MSGRRQSVNEREGERNIEGMTETTAEAKRSMMYRQVGAYRLSSRASGMRRNSDGVKQCIRQLPIPYSINTPDIAC